MILKQEQEEILTFVNGVLFKNGVGLAPYQNNQHQ